MPARNFKALIVDDEAVVRQLTHRALTREGFSCDIASDGVEALTLVDRNQYDVVLTDLRMPNRHGHALATELLEREERPAIVVLTGLAEPRLAKDLMARGVDDILFKPIEYSLLAAKLRALVERRAADKIAASPLPDEPAKLDEVVPPFEVTPEPASISGVALKICRLALSPDDNLFRIAELAASEPALAAEILRQAQDAARTDADRSALDLPSAIQRIGCKRVGELALTLGASRRPAQPA